MNRDLRLLALSLFLWGVGEGLFIYLLPVYLTQLGAGAVQVGAILGLAGLATTITHIPAGILADHYGRKTVMILAWLVGTVAVILMFLSPSLRLFVAALVLYYLTSFVMSPLSSYVTTARGGWTTGRALTTISASFNAGSVIGPVTGGLLAARLGIRPLFGFSAVLFVFSTLMLYLLRDQPLEPPHAEGRFRSLFANRTAARILLVAFCAMLALSVGWSLTPLFLTEVRGLSVAQLGALGSVFALGIVVLNLTLGAAPARRGSMLAQGIVAGAFVLLWRGMSMPAYALGYFLAGGMRTARSLFSAQVERVVRRSHLGLAFGVAETVASAALIVAPLVAGLLYHVDPASPFIVSLFLIAGSLALSLRLLPTAHEAEAIARLDQEI
ncbi:MAG TPA: MFS transporter [Anaerolineales bacterium]|nr:MFS transporter [Anaerolineales bacterium]